MTRQPMLKRTAGLLVLALLATRPAAADVFETAVLPEEHEAFAKAEYRVWIPQDVPYVRAVIVRQHGCGEGARRLGLEHADDIQWRALARKWDCALLGSRLWAPEEDCTTWTVPEDGSARAFLSALEALGEASGHTELERVPWLLWGHSGGAWWVMNMTYRFPHRVIATFPRSGGLASSGMTFSRSQPARPDENPEALEVPILFCYGEREAAEGNGFRSLVDGVHEVYRYGRAHGARWALAVHPDSEHENANSRALAIRFFDAWLARRLPQLGQPGDAHRPRPIDSTDGWLADPESGEIRRDSAGVEARATEGWLPDEVTARAWREFVRSGEIRDTTPPPSPYDVRLAAIDDGVRIEWTATADVESGIETFRVLRDGTTLGEVRGPVVERHNPKGAFHAWNYHDQPFTGPDWPTTRFEDRTEGCSVEKRYTVLAVNRSGLLSDESPPATVSRGESTTASSDTARAVPHRQARPPNRPYSPQEAVARMVVPDGFTVEVVASEPQVVNPLAFAFDDRGRLWLTESVDYPRADGGPGRDRVQILEDTDRDGHADRFTVFADDLNIPSGIELGHGGVWILNAPDLLFIREEDGRAAERETVVTGFGRTDRHELPNSLTWGPDGWLYGLNGVFNRSRIVSKGKEYRFTCALWRVHPSSHEFQVVCEGTSNPWGLIFDAEGNALVSACHWAKDHVFHFVPTGVYQRQAGAYPAHAWRLGSVSDHGHQKTAYCGLAWLDTDVYPKRYRGRLIMGNVHGGALNVDRLERDGATYISHGEADLLIANDVWCMPVSMKVGPDGCLWVLDWYDRYHCYQDAGRDPEGIDRARGRIYRLRYRDAPRAAPFDLESESDDALVSRLASPNVFYRGRAQRLLTERGKQETRDVLRNVVRDATASRRARLHALWALVGTGVLDSDFHQELLVHPDPTFRAWGVRAAGELGEVDPRLRARLASLALDHAPEVGLEVAIAAGRLDGIEPLPILVNVLTACGNDRLVPPIVWSNLHPLLDSGAGSFATLVRAADLGRAPALARLLPRAIGRALAAREPDSAAISVLLRRVLERRTEDGGSTAREALSVVAERLDELDDDSRRSLAARLEPMLAELLGKEEETDPVVLAARLVGARLGVVELDASKIRAVLLDREGDEPTRLRALEALVSTGDPELLRTIDEVLAEATPSLASEVLAILGTLDGTRVADILLARYDSFPSEVQPLALDLLLERKSWARKLLDRVLSGKLPGDTLRPVHLRRYLDGNDRDAIWAIEERWGTVRTERNPEREQIAREIGSFLAETPGSPQRGRRVFEKLCSQCHVLYGTGSDVGPDLTTNGRASFEQLLSNVFDPSLVVGAGYRATTVVTSDGRVLSGLVVEDSKDRLAIRMQGGRREVLPRADVKSVTTSDLSLMPEGVEDLVSRDELADLFAFLALDGPPGDPPPRAIPGAPAWVEEVSGAEARR